MKKLIFILTTLASVNVFAANPWNCVNALGASDSNNPNTVGCDDNTNNAPPPVKPTATPTPSNDTQAKIPSGNTLAMMYIANSSSITQCKINATGVNLFSCNNVKPSKATAADFANVTGITSANKMMYITNNYNQITMCKFSSSGVDVSSCNKVTVPAEGMASYPVVINNDLLYTARAKIYRCPINSSGLIDGSQCTGFTMGDDQNILGLTVANNMVYMVKQSKRFNDPNSIVQCSINDSGIDSSSCTEEIPTGVGSMTDTNSIYVNSSSAYIVNNKNITQCSIKNSSIQVDSCQNYAINDETMLNNVAVYNNRLYTINHYLQGTLYQCNLNGKGLDANSCKTLTLGGDNQLQQARGLIIQ